MSTIHYSTAELANVLTTVITHQDTEAYIAHIAQVLHKCSVSNTYAAQADGWPEADTQVTTEAALRAAKPLAGNLERALSTMCGMQSNCNGFLGDKVGAQVAGLLSTLARKLMHAHAEVKESLTAAREKISSLQTTAPRKAGRK